MGSQSFWRGRFGKRGENREGDHLRVAKPEDPPHTPPSWARRKFPHCGNVNLSRGWMYDTLLDV